MQLDSTVAQTPTMNKFPILISVMALLLSGGSAWNSYLSRSDGFKQMRVGRQIEECMKLAEATSETNSRLATLEIRRFWQDEDISRIEDINGSLVERDEAQRALTELKRLVVRSKVIFPKAFRDNLNKLELASDAVFRENFDVIFGKVRKAVSASRLEEMAFLVIGDCNRLANSDFSTEDLQ